VVFLGDSVTFGVAVGDDETFVSLAEQQLNRGTRDFCFANMAVPGLGLEDYVRLNANHVADLKPNLVVVCLLLNDTNGFSLWELLANREPWEAKLRASPLYKLAFVRVVYGLIRMFKTNSPQAQIYLPWIPEFLSKEYLSDENAWNQLLFDARLDWSALWYDDAWPEFTKKIEQINSQNIGRGIHTAFVILPMYPQVEAYGRYKNITQPEDRLRAYLEKKNIPLFDPLPLLALYPVPAPMFDQCHLTRSGHKIVAKGLAEFLTSLLVTAPH
jgi:lysophospholipase L1-like esterase